jgi:ribonuclease III
MKPEKFESLQQALDYRFINAELMTLALTHRSAARAHNQRLEFLGDAALGFVMADILYQRFPLSSEGELSQIRASLVNRTALAAIARRLKLGELIVLGLGEKKSGGQQRDSILCDALEALLGAIYLDGGMQACSTCISNLFGHHLAPGGEQQLMDSKDAKTRLQEMTQGRGLSLPNYEVLDIRGDEHQQEFFVSCDVQLIEKKVTGQGRTRREAEQHAAQQVLVMLESLPGKHTN